MIVRVRMATVARVAAALVAVMLSGGPHALALMASAEAHRCCCRSHGSPQHECDCAMCRRAALAEQAKDDKAPPCHRAAARKALSRGCSPGSRSAPCVEGTCGSSNGPVTTPAGIEPFPIPAATLLAATSRQEWLVDGVQAVRRRPLEPEKPPPRAA